MALNLSIDPRQQLVVTDGGAPTEGTFTAGWRAVDPINGRNYVCTVAGAPGTWVHAGAARGSVGLYGDAFTAGGEAALARRLVSSAAITTTSGTLYLTYFTATKTESCGNIRTAAGTAAAATPTLCRMGVYSVDATGNLTLINSTANDTTLWSANNTSYTKALTTAFSKVIDTTYALGMICVSATTMPQMAGVQLTGSGAVWGDFTTLPYSHATVAGQSDLPASVAVGSLAQSNRVMYAAVLP